MHREAEGPNGLIRKCLQEIGLNSVGVLQDRDQRGLVLSLEPALMSTVFGPNNDVLGISFQVIPFCLHGWEQPYSEAFSKFSSLRLDSGVSFLSPQFPHPFYLSWNRVSFAQTRADLPLGSQPRVTDIEERPLP